MLLPFSHFPRHINATRIMLTSEETNGENSSLKGGGECPPLPIWIHSGAVPNAHAEYRSAVWKASWSSNCCGNTFPLCLAVILIFHHSGSIWRRSSADGFPATTHTARLQGALRSQWAAECSMPKPLLLLSRQTGMKGWVPSFCEYLNSVLYSSTPLVIWRIDALLFLRKSIIRLSQVFVSTHG